MIFLVDIFSLGNGCCLTSKPSYEARYSGAFLYIGLLFEMKIKRASWCSVGRWQFFKISRGLRGNNWLISSHGRCTYHRSCLSLVFASANPDTLRSHHTIHSYVSEIFSTLKFVALRDEPWSWWKIPRKVFSDVGELLWHDPMVICHCMTWIFWAVWGDAYKSRYTCSSEGDQETRTK